MARSIESGALGASDVARAKSNGWDSLSAGDVVEALDRLTDGIMVLGADWRVRYINEPAVATLRRRHSELRGKNIWGEFPEAVGGPFPPGLRGCAEHGHEGRLVEYYAPLERWFEIRTFTQEDKLVILFRDLTDDQRIEDALREYVDRISEAERIVRCGVWRWEIATGACAGPTSCTASKVWRQENSRARSMPSWSSFIRETASASGPTSPTR